MSPRGSVEELVTIQQLQFSFQSPLYHLRVIYISTELGLHKREKGSLIQLSPLQASLVSGCQGDFRDPLLDSEGINHLPQLLADREQVWGWSLVQMPALALTHLTRCQLRILREPTLVWFYSWAGVGCVSFWT